MSHLYRPIYRPSSFSTLPQWVKWEYAEAPTMAGLCNRSDLPRSAHRFGIISTDRALTPEEAARFDLLGV